MMDYYYRFIKIVKDFIIMEKKKYRTLLIGLFLLPLLTGCGDSGSNGDEELTTAYEEYEQSTPTTQYRTSSKLLNTLFKGPDPTLFFKENGRISLDHASDEYSLQSIRSKLDTPLDSREIIFWEIDDFYQFDTNSKPLQYPLTTLYEMPLSSDYFNFWIGYILANTILFSPAVELDSVEALDAQRVYHRLVTLLDEGKSISEIAYEHMLSQENWRRFRSPEDNTREMMEIFLGRFMDEEVPKAAKACQNWYLSDDSQDYQLIKTFNVNETAQSLLDTQLTTCEEFYRRVSTHPSLLPRVIGILVDYFYDGASDEAKASIVNRLVAQGYTHFKPLFLDIIFSESYLLETERPKKYEELFLGLGQSIRWKANYNFFRYLNRDPSSSNQATLMDMNQASMRYKLGRNGSVPLDSLSFSYVHNSVRDSLFFDRKTNEFSDYDGGWQAGFIDIVLAEGSDFIDYVFVSLLGRVATEDEKTTLNEVFVSQGEEEDELAQTLIMMDYISRLTELYYFK